MTQYNDPNLHPHFDGDHEPRATHICECQKTTLVEHCIPHARKSYAVVMPAHEAVRRGLNLRNYWIMSCCRGMVFNNSGCPDNVFIMYEVTPDDIKRFESMNDHS